MTTYSKIASRRGSALEERATPYRRTQRMQDTTRTAWRPDGARCFPRRAWRWYVEPSVESNHGPLDDCSSSALPLSYSAQHTWAPRQAHELNVRTSRRLLIERSTAELLDATCLGVTANAESNRGPLGDCSPSALPLSYSPRRTQTPRLTRESNAWTFRRLLTGCSTTELLTWYTYVPGTGAGITPNVRESRRTVMEPTFVNPRRPVWRPGIRWP